MQQFLAVAETLNFHRAAERLNMAQPPLTAAIRQMEQELGVRLIRRSNRVTGLTPAGHMLQEEADRTLRQAERAVFLTRRAGAGEVGSLRLGFVASAMRHLLPLLIRSFRTSHPDVSLMLMELTTARQVAALLEDRQDVGVVALPLPIGTETRIATKLLLHSHFLAAIPDTHVLAKLERPLQLSALAREPWILFPPSEGPGLHGTILRACVRVGFSPNVAQEAVQMDTIVGLVASGLGVALVPAPVAETGRSGVVFRQITGAGTPVPYDLALAWRNEDQSTLLTAFRGSVGGA